MQGAGMLGVLDGGGETSRWGWGRGVSGVTLTIGPTSPVSPFSPEGPGKPCAGVHSTDQDDRPTREQLQVHLASSALPPIPHVPQSSAAGAGQQTHPDPTSQPLPLLPPTHL